MSGSTSLGLVAWMMALTMPSNTSLGLAIGVAERLRGDALGVTPCLFSDALGVTQPLLGEAFGAFSRVIGSARLPGEGLGVRRGGHPSQDGQGE